MKIAGLHLWEFDVEYIDRRSCEATVRLIISLPRRNEAAAVVKAKRFLDRRPKQYRNAAINGFIYQGQIDA